MTFAEVDTDCGTVVSVMCAPITSGCRYYNTAAFFWKLDGSEIFTVIMYSYFQFLGLFQQKVNPH